MSTEFDWGKKDITAAVPKDLSLFRHSEKTPYLTDGYNGKIGQ